MRVVLTLIVVGLVTAAPARAAVIPVDTFLDAPAAGNCSLREAIRAANTEAVVDNCPAGSGADVIQLGVGTYKLTVQGAREDNNLTGDLDVFSPVTLQGVSGSTISADGLGDRVLDVLIGGSLRLDFVAVIRGDAPDGADATTLAQPGGRGDEGGGIRSMGPLDLVHSSIDDNRAGDGGKSLDGSGQFGGDGGPGGGIYSNGPVTIVSSVISDNRAGTGGSSGAGANAVTGAIGGSGGGIFTTLAAGTTTIERSRVVDNAAGAGGTGGGGCALAGGGLGGSGGGIVASGLVLTAGLIGGNRAGDGGTVRGVGSGCLAGVGAMGGDGGGAFVTAPATITNVLFAGNAAGRAGAGGAAADGPGGNGGLSGSGGDLNLRAGATITHTTMTGGTVHPGGAGGAGGPGSQPGLPGPAGLGSAMWATGGAANVASSILDGTCFGTTSDGGHNLQTTADCVGLQTDPLLGPNGVPTLGSPAIDAAPTTGCPATDSTGTTRPQGVACDIGAFEVAAAAPVVSPTALAFGRVTVGARATRAVSASNPGLAGLTLPATVTGTGFSIAANTCGGVFAGGATCAVTVAFAPLTTGARSGRLDLGTQAVTLSGTGAAKPAQPPRPQPQPQAEPCVVPKLKGKTVKKARKALRRAHCRLGTVKRRGHGRPGRVRRSRPKAGTVLAPGATVNIVVNRRR